MGNLNSMQNTYAREKLPGKSRKYSRVGQHLIISLIIKVGTSEPVPHRFRGEGGNRKIHKACSSHQGRGRYNGLMYVVYFVFTQVIPHVFRCPFAQNNSKSPALKHGLSSRISSGSQLFETWNPSPQT